jgi:hypothetical protein
MHALCSFFFFLIKMSCAEIISPTQKPADARLLVEATTAAADPSGTVRRVPSPARRRVARAPSPQHGSCSGRAWWWVRACLLPRPAGAGGGGEEVEWGRAGRQHVQHRRAAVSVWLQEGGFFPVVCVGRGVLLILCRPLCLCEWGRPTRRPPVRVREPSNRERRVL